MSIFPIRDGGEHLLLLSPKRKQPSRSDVRHIVRSPAMPRRPTGAASSDTRRNGGGLDGPGLGESSFDGSGGLDGSGGIDGKRGRQPRRWPQGEGLPAGIPSNTPSPDGGSVGGRARRYLRSHLALRSRQWRGRAGVDYHRGSWLMFLNFWTTLEVAGDLAPAGAGKTRGRKRLVKY